MKEFSSFNSKDSDQMSRTVDYIEEFYGHLEKEIQENPTLDILQNLPKLTEKGFYRPLNTEYINSQFSFDDIKHKIPSSSAFSGSPNVWDAQIKLQKQQEGNQANEEELVKYSFFGTVRLFFHVWLSHWEYFCYFMLIIYQIQAQGVVMLIISFAIFGYAITEENRCAFKFWTISCGFIVIITVTKFAMTVFFLQVIHKSNFNLTGSLPFWRPF